MIIGLETKADLETKKEGKVSLLEWYAKINEKLKKYGGGGFMGNSHIHLYWKQDKKALIVVEYQSPKHIIRPYWITLIVCGMALLFGSPWWVYVIGIAFSAFEFFLSPLFVYYSLALSLQRKTGIKEYKRVSSHDIGHYLLEAEHEPVSTD